MRTICLLLLLAVGAQAQVLSLRREEGVMLKVTTMSPSGLPTSVPRALLGNAVRIGGDLALTAGHCAPDTTSRLTLNGLPAKVLLTGPDLALLRVAGLPAMIPIAHVALGPAVTGEELQHRYFDVYEKRERHRKVQWAGDGHIEQDYRHGMSGSGLYDEAGMLIGICEATDGFTWDVLQIGGFLDKARAQDVLVPDIGDLLPAFLIQD